MRRNIVIPLLVLAALVFPSVVYSSDCCETKSTSDFVALFNGKDLSGWEVEGPQAWTVRDGVLYCSGEGIGWLRSKKQYKDFVLQLEYKVGQEANSGVFIRATKEGNPAFTGMEIQILNDYGRKPTQRTTGSMYSAIAPKVNASKPAGEWNEYQISCIGNMITVRLNGRRIMHADISNPAINAALMEGPKLTDRAKIGHIGLQNHGFPLQFRNIQIRKM
ncbi:MAG: DUF1080 domain-containing protein [Armatimonadota bacterium]|nr:DUF1080 domain-containing protein [Armatimonadota bacterium]